MTTITFGNIFTLSGQVTPGLSLLELNRLRVVQVSSRFRGGKSAESVKSETSKGTDTTLSSRFQESPRQTSLPERDSRK